jgi:hypothetical protein
MKIQIPKDPIILSLLVGALVLIGCLLIFVITKPNMITNINKDKKKHIHWFRLIFVSITISIAISICTFLILTKDRKVNYRQEMSFHRNY